MVLAKGKKKKKKELETSFPAGLQQPEERKHLPVPTTGDSKTAAPFLYFLTPSGLLLSQMPASLLHHAGCEEQHFVATSLTDDFNCFRYRCSRRCLGNCVLCQERLGARTVCVPEPEKQKVIIHSQALSEYTLRH